MKKNILHITYLFIFFSFISVIFLIYNQKLNHQQITLQNFDDIGPEALFKIIAPNGKKIDISEDNLKIDLIKRNDTKVLFSKVLRAIQSNKIYRYNYKIEFDLKDDEFHYLSKILDNIELEGAYFLNPDQLSDSIINLYANDLDRAYKVFFDFYKYITREVLINEYLNDNNRILVYKKIILETLFNKYSNVNQLNLFITLLKAFNYNEVRVLKNKNEKLNEIYDNYTGELIFLLEKIFRNYLKDQTSQNYKIYIDTIKKEKIIETLNQLINISEGIDFKNYYNSKSEIIINERRLKYLKQIKEYIDYFTSNEFQYFNYIKSYKLDEYFIYYDSNSKKIIEEFRNNIPDENLLEKIINIIDENKELKRLYNNSINEKDSIIFKNILKDTEIYDEINFDNKIIEKYSESKLNTVNKEINILYILSLFLFSFISAVIVVGISFSFKKD